METSSHTSLPYSKSASIHYIYCENEHQPNSQLDFALDIIDEILEETALLNPLSPAGGGQRLTGRDMHYLTPIPPTEKRLNPTRNCKICTIPSNDKRPGENNTSKGVKVDTSAWNVAEFHCVYIRATNCIIQFRTSEDLF
ncbi:hypothetical protein PoB_000755900 [Plakobranchus ocellatus]|uniref:Uncharacterized protein n=1 Tax=Plakobranchus ocellatus TaxID=259542 RepID=A0AAV3YG88_9GAST|nr:hypothetical protein PoB_000755900 [Plakobranchus ocellatus]